jgi:acyl carrier protein
MNSDEIRQAIFAALRPIAPEVEADEIDPALPLRAQIDLDSMDFLNFVVALHKRLGVDIPESDYARLDTLDAIVEYLVRRLEQKGHPPGSAQA